jgi:hypothetical protein
MQLYAIQVCNGLAGEVPLASLPQLADVFAKSHAELGKMLGFVAAVEEELAECLRAGRGGANCTCNKI